MRLIEDEKFLVPSQPNIDSNIYRDRSFTQPITSREQRREYKKEFDKYYNEYQHLYTAMISARDRFKILHDQLKSTNSQERAKFQEIQAQIAFEYRESCNNASIQQKRQRFEFLHQKLSTIKRLVNDFDARLKNERHD